MARLLVPLVFLFTMMPVRATAQTVASPADLAQQVNIGDRIRLVDASGRTWEGRVTVMTPARLVIRDHDRLREFEAATLREVAVRGDSLVNGALIGFVAGGALGYASTANFSGEFRAGDGFFGLALFGAMGAGIGVTVDALITRHRIVYRAAEGVAIMPIIQPGRRYGVVVRISR